MDRAEFIFPKKCNNELEWNLVWFESWMQKSSAIEYSFEFFFNLVRLRHKSGKKYYTKYSPRSACVISSLTWTCWMHLRRPKISPSESAEMFTRADHVRELAQFLRQDSWNVMFIAVGESPFVPPYPFRLPQNPTRRAAEVGFLSVIQRGVIINRT